MGKKKKVTASSGLITSVEATQGCTCQLFFSLKPTAAACIPKNNRNMDMWYNKQRIQYTEQKGGNLRGVNVGSPFDMMVCCKVQNGLDSISIMP